jgi:8-oxo-dGTP pyrophosphatase MutT (NUDIX family)
MSPVSAPITLDDVRRTLRAHKQRNVPGATHLKKAAVAAIFRQVPSRLELLFIRRAEHPHDPWSGHMAFPGGRVDPSDSGPLGAAVRETREELSLDLDTNATLVGELSHVPAVAHGRPVPMVIFPFVFSLTGESSLVPDAREVQEAVWVPFDFLLDEANRNTLERRIAGVPMRLPAYHYEGRTIWGLTLKMVDELMGLVQDG